jgi:hypothetical protein
MQWNFMVNDVAEGFKTKAKNRGSSPSKSESSSICTSCSFIKNISLQYTFTC